LYAFLPESDPSLYRHSLEKISRLKNISRILPSHNDLDIAKYFIQDILIAFNDLDKKKQLKKGTGIYNYDSFKISL
ncbi:MAG: fold metallo-hydrolase, partial [Firmicutes bacterium]|nr:fold metallo-hydrolase [Bacillota bacterium]